MSVTCNLLDPTVDYPVPQPHFMGKPGPYEHGSDLYWVCLEQPADTMLHLNIVAYKSTDGGVTFTRFPELTYTNGGGVMCVSYPGTGTLIYIAWRGTESGFQHGDIHTATFDMATDTFSVVNDPGITITGSNREIFLEMLPNGDLILVWQQSQGGLFEILARVYSSGSWSSDITIYSDAAIFATLWVVVINGDGDLVVFYDDLASMFSVIITGTSVSSPTTVLASIADFTSTDFPQSAIYDANSDTIAWVILQRTGLGDPHLRLILGTPSNAPVYSIQDVADDPGAAELWNNPSLAANAAGTAFYIITWPTNESDTLYQQFTAGALTGPWSAPTVFYNQTTNPPSPPPSTPELYPTWATVLSTGDLVVTAGNIYDVFGPSFCGVLVYLAPESSPETQTLELTKIVVGGSAAPEDFTLSAIGGSPEVEISGQGHVGPTEVSPGTYELSETILSNATWDDATGTWASNDNTWNGNYVPGAWDCGDAEMPTPTSVVVPPASGGGLPISRPPVLIDPTGFSRQITAELNPMEFKVGENLYAFLISQVTNRFGIFKSTNGGATWVEKDAAGSPDSNASSAVLNGTIICVNIGGALVEFDTDTDTYGTPGDSGGLSGPIYAQADGTYVALDSATGTHIRYSTYKFSDGFWVGPTNLLAGNLPLASVIGDSADAGHVSYYDGTDLKYFRLSSGFVVGSPATLGAISGSQLRTSSAIWGDRVAIAWADGSNIKISIGTPLSGPTISTATVYTRLSSDEDVSYPTLLVDNDDSLRCYFVVTNYNTDPFIDELRVSTSTDGATWPTAEVFYNEITNPPSDSVPDQESQFVHTGDVVQLSSGRVVFLAALETSDDGNAHCTGFALIADPPSGQPVSCRITNTFTPTPPPPGPGNGEENPVGCFELLRVDVTLMPSRHLPTRGSVR